MAISISGSNAISGLGGSDTNFDDTLAKLKKIESTQLNRLEAWKGDWKLRYEAFGSIIDQVQAASKMLGSLSDRNKFVTKNVTSSDQNVITAVANASAQDVQHSIKVLQVANNAIWANTGQIFDSKTESITNESTPDTGTDFKFTYAGKEHSIHIPKGTTLDSFASLVNNSTENPGIKVSLIQSGGGYVFQIAGKDTGAENNLIIHDNAYLKGMSAAGSISTWLTNNGLDPSALLTDPGTYAFDVVMQDGRKKTITLKGDATNEELKNAINTQLGGDPVASLDASGNLVLQRVKSFGKRKSDDEAYSPAGTRISVGSNLNDPLISATSTEILKFRLTMNDGNTREFEIKGSATRKEFLIQLAQATQGGEGVDLSMDASGAWGVDLSGVQDGSLTLLNGSTGFDMSTLTHTPIAQKGDPSQIIGSLSGPGATALTTLTFDQSKLNSKISDADPPVDLVYMLTKKDGSAVYVKGITSDMTNQQLLDKIKDTLDAEGMTYTAGTDADGNATLAVDDAQGFALTTGSGGMAGVTAKVETSTNVAANDVFYTDPADPSKVTLEAPPDLNYTVRKNDGTVVNIGPLPSGSSMQDVMDAFVAALGPDAEIVDAEGDPWVAGTSTGQPYLKLNNIADAGGPGLQGQVATSSNWSIQRATNARYQVDNWPMEMESASNTVSDVIDGVVFSIQDVGEARISVSTDIPSVEQSIQNFLDAVNSVLLTIREFTQYDEDKEVTSSDPKDEGKDNYSPSQLTSEKGGLLQGNYGVQLFSTRFKSLLNSSPPGFKGRQSADDILSGDVLANLANLGIKTNTDESSDMYGLLEIAPQSSIAELQSLDKENYSNMINNNLEAVVDFFCTSGTGSSTSADFRYGSHVEGITKAGNYDVEYEVNGSGQITKVTIGGVEATRDESMPGYYYSVGSGDARGLSIQIDNLAPGTHTGQVRIKQGLVQTVDSFFKSELVFTDVKINPNDSPDKIADAIALKSKNGALMVLRDNYKTIMENIDAKIEREQRRIETWEARQKKIFANLETLLKQYDEQQKRLDSQIKSMKSSTGTSS